MNTLLHNATLAALPVFATAGAIATLAAGGMAFPAPLELLAWPQWLVLASLVFTYSTVGSWLARKVLATTPERHHVPAQTL